MAKISINQRLIRFIPAIVPIIFWVLIWSKILIVKPDGWFSTCSNCWGDWSAHLTYTSSFAYAHNWPLELPVYLGHKFTYPFVVDLISAGLVKLGLDLPASLVWPGLIGSVILTYLIYLLAKTFSQSHQVGGIATILFLFNGGWGSDSRFYNFITSQIIPQRGQLLGLNLSIIVYLLLWRKKIIPAGIVAGLLPLMHAHSYLVTLMVGAWFGWRFWVPALALGLPQIAYVYGFTAGHFFAWDPVWLKEWWRLGLVLPLFIYSWFKAPPKLKRFSVPFWLVFFAANLVRFQPYDWDNTKLFLHWYLIASISAAIVLVRWRLIGWLILPLLIFPGVRDVSKIIQGNNQYQFFNPTQLIVAEAARNILPKNAVVLTASNHNHWLPTLTGRQIVMGYPGWLWTYGIDYLPRQAEVIKMYQGNAELLNQYEIDFVVIGPDEKNTFADLNEAYFAADFSLVFDQSGYKIFLLSTPGVD